MGFAQRQGFRDERSEVRSCVSGQNFSRQDVSDWFSVREVTTHSGGIRVASGLVVDPKRRSGGSGG